MDDEATTEDRLFHMLEEHRRLTAEILKVRADILELLTPILRELGYSYIPRPKS
jgi:hypothetical protein